MGRFFVLGLVAVFVAACGSGGNDGGSVSGSGLDDIEHGNILIEEVAVPATAALGDTIEVSVNLHSETRKNHVYIKMDLYELPEGENIASLVADQLVASMSFRPHEDYHEVSSHIVEEVTPGAIFPVEFTADIPSDLNPGNYAVIFSLNFYQIRTDENSGQGELIEDNPDNHRIASNTLLLSDPESPDIRIEHLSADEYSFSVGENYLHENDFSIEGHDEMLLNLQLVGAHRNVLDPFHVNFDLEIPGHGVFPLLVLDENEQGEHVKRNFLEFDSHCYDQHLDDVQGEKVECAALFVNETRGVSAELHLTEEIYDILKTLDQDTECQVLVYVDSFDAIDEHHETNNDSSLNIMYIPDGNELPSPEVSVASSTELGPYSSTIKNSSKDSSWGKTDSVKSGYSSHFKVNKKPGSVPTAFYSSLGSNAYGYIFGHRFDIFDAYVRGDLNINNVTASYFDAKLDLAGKTLIHEYKSLTRSSDGSVHPAVLLTTADPNTARIYQMSSWTKNAYGITPSSGGKSYPAGVYTWGNYQSVSLYEKYKTAERTKRFTLGPVPMKATVGYRAKGALGGSVTAYAGNRLNIKAFPFIDIDSFTDVGVDIKVASAGIHGSVNMVTLSYPVSHYENNDCLVGTYCWDTNPRDLGLSFQILPADPYAKASIKNNLHLESLDGHIYLYAKINYLVGSKKWTQNIVNWTGPRKDFSLHAPYVKEWR